MGVSILQSLFAADPSNYHYHQEALYRRIMLARLVGENGQLDQALGMLKEIEADFGVIDGLETQGSVAQHEYINLLLASAEAELRQGQPERAKAHLQKAIDLQLKKPHTGDVDIFDLQRMVLTRYLWWQLEGDKDLDSLPVMHPVDQDPGVEFRSCVEADSNARMFVIEGQREKSAKEVEYLTGRGYAEPSFIRFCRKHALCS